MPQFFSEKNLTQEQKANWDSSIDKYKKTLDFNIQSEFKKMTEEDKKKFMADFKIKTFTDKYVLQKLEESINVMANPPGHEKSALFFRILSGERILKNAPPTSFSYPDYDIIESNKEREISWMDNDNGKINKLVNKPTKYINYRHIFINQSAWKIKEIISPTRALITHGRWENEGFVWELEFKQFPAKDSQSAIISHYNQNIGKITTYHELLEEAAYHARDYFYALVLAKNSQEYEKFKQEMIAKVGNMGSAIAEQKLKYGETLLASRKSLGLPDEATEGEILEKTMEITKNYLGKDYVVKDGLLYKQSWVMKRISPQIIDDKYYVDI